LVEDQKSFKVYNLLWIAYLEWLPALGQKGNLIIIFLFDGC